MQCGQIATLPKLPGQIEGGKWRWLQSDRHRRHVTILMAVLASYLCQVFVVDTVLIRGGTKSWGSVPLVRQQWHSHPLSNVVAEILGNVVRKPHDCLVAMAIAMHLLVLAAKFLGESKELLPTSAMLVLVSAHGTAVATILVNIVKLWGLEQQHNQLETLQLLCSPFCTLLRVAVLFDDGVQFLSHGLEVVSLVCGTRHLRPCSAQVAFCRLRRHVGHLTRMHTVRWVALISATDASKSSSLPAEGGWDFTETLSVCHIILEAA